MYKRLVSICLVVMIFGIAFWLRLRAASLLPIDFDEDDYLLAAIHYAEAFRDRDFQEIVDYEHIVEHPPLTKLIYGLGIVPLSPAPERAENPQTTLIAASLPEPHLCVSRIVSAVFVTVVFFYTKSNRKGDAWFFLSAAALGLTAASKYPYAVVGCAVLAHWLSADRKQIKDDRAKPQSTIQLPVVAWAAIARIILVCFNPRLWHDPVSRLWVSLVFHRAYAQSNHVRQVGFPFWQPLVWIFRSVPWHSGVFLISIDELMSLLAVIGFKRLWQSYRVYALWLVFTLGFLLFWPTKWPQYVLWFTAPLSMSAALGFALLIGEPFKAVIHSVSKAANHASARTSAGWYNR